MTDAERKQAMIRALADMPQIVVSIAFAYAQSMISCGVDISEKWETVTQQKAALEMAYQRGRYDEQKRIFSHRKEGGDG